jgi:hypothetical protein
MSTPKLGDIVVLNTKPGGITRADWVIITIATNSQGIMYTLRSSSNYMTTTTVSNHEMEREWTLLRDQK